VAARKEGEKLCSRKNRLKQGDHKGGSAPTEHGDGSAAAGWVERAPCHLRRRKPPKKEVTSEEGVVKHVGNKQRRKPSGSWKNRRTEGGAGCGLGLICEKRVESLKVHKKKAGRVQ